MTPTLTPTNLKEYIGNVKNVLEQDIDLIHINI